MATQEFEGMQRPERTGMSKFLEFEFTFGLSNATVAFTAPAKSWILSRYLSVDTAWGVGASIKLGSAADNGLLVDAAVLTSTGGQAFTTPVYVDTETVFYFYTTHAASATGLARILVEVVEVNQY